MKSFLLFLACVFAPFLVAWLLYLFVFWGADPWPGDWTQKARGGIAAGLVGWSALVTLFAIS